MAREFAKEFYNSSEWIKCRNGYMESQNYICERCGDIATICHHKIELTPENIDDPYITLNWDLLMAVCLDCHNRIHGNNGLREGLKFDEKGNLVRENPLKLKQKIKIILGYPASGKTTYAKANMGEHDLIIDLDMLVAAMTLKPIHDRQDNSMYAVKIANDFIRHLLENLKSKPYKFNTLYIIRTKLNSEEYRILKELGAEMYWINTNKETCIERLQSQGRTEVIKAIDGCDIFYRQHKDELVLI